MLTFKIIIYFSIIHPFLLFLRCLIPLRVQTEEITIIWSFVFWCRTAHFPAKLCKNVYICVHAQVAENVRNFLYLWPTILKHQYGKCVNWKQEMWSDALFWLFILLLPVVYADTILSTFSVVFSAYELFNFSVECYYICEPFRRLFDKSNQTNAWYIF